MVIATHLIKVSGQFDINIWNNISLKEYVKNKMLELEYCLHPDLELFDINNNNIDIWILIHALPSEVNQSIVDLWAKNHITEKGLIVNSIKIEIINSLINPKSIYISI